jgi:hypothetical protein
VNRLGGIWLRGFVWIVAIMLPVQPLAASHCSCCHSTDTAVVKKLGAKHVSCSSERCGCSSKHKLPDQGTQAKVPFAPCECPANCPCHLQHAPKLGVKTQEVQLEKSDSVVFFVVPTQHPAVKHESRQTLSNVEHGIIVSETALELCAALCRFTI